jgi:hypothetical protein
MVGPEISPKPLKNIMQDLLKDHRQQLLKFSHHLHISVRVVGIMLHKNKHIGGIPHLTMPVVQVVYMAIFFAMCYLITGILHG